MKIFTYIGKIVTFLRPHIKRTFFLESVIFVMPNVTVWQKIQEAAASVGFHRDEKWQFAANYS